MNMIFGQFLDHDITLTPESRTTAEECCTSDATHGKFSGECIPVWVPKADEVFRVPVRCYGMFSLLCLQDDHTGCTQPPFDIKTKVAF